MRFRRRAGDDPVDRRVIWQCASLLLGYPDENFADRLDLVTAAAGALPAAVGEPLLGCARELSGIAQVAAAMRYVDTFDWRRRRTLFLTYYTAGDTRGRGMALLEFASAYRQAGARPPAGELPDHLAVVLEFAATVDESAGYRLLAAHRTPIDLLLDGLRRMGSPYAAVVGAVAQTLPPPSEHDQRAARRLAMQGPPVETVGLEPFSMPGALPSPGPVDIALGPNPRIPIGKGLST